jgi:hypothetical protein
MTTTATEVPAEMTGGAHVPAPSARDRQTDRRGMLRAALGAATATVAAGALLDSRAGVARASGAEGPTTFTSSGPSPAVTVGATNGADGVVISSVNTSTTPGMPNGTVRGAVPREHERRSASGR